VEHLARTGLASIRRRSLLFSQICEQSAAELAAARSAEVQLSARRLSTENALSHTGGDGRSFDALVYPKWYRIHDQYREAQQVSATIQETSAKCRATSRAADQMLRVRLRHENNRANQRLLSELSGQHVLASLLSKNYDWIDWK
jgi:hypothetical protein